MYTKTSSIKKYFLYQVLLALVPVLIAFPSIIWWSSASIATQKVTTENIERRVVNLEEEQKNIIEIDKKVSVILIKIDHINENLKEIKKYSRNNRLARRR